MTNKLHYLAIGIVCFFLGAIITNFGTKPKTSLGVNPKFVESEVIKQKTSVANPVVYQLSHNYVITLGVFRNEYLAKKLAKKHADLTSKTKKIKVGGEVMTLVEVGPFSSYKETKKIKAQIYAMSPELGNLVIQKRKIK